MAANDAEFDQALELERCGDTAAARRRYLEILRAAPGHADTLFRLAMLDYRAGAAEDAERLVRRALESNPNGTGFQMGLGQILRSRGRLEEAAAAFQAELRQRPDHAATWRQVGLLLMQQGQLTAALKAVQKSIFHAPRFAAAYNTLGRVYNNMGRLDQAVQAFRRALYFDSRYAEAAGNLGHVLRRNGDRPGAEKQFRRAIEFDPKWQPAHRHLAILLLEDGRAAEAIEHFEHALALDNSDALAHFGLGVIFQERGMLEPARRHFDHAIEIRPEYADAHCNLGAVYRSSAQLDKARQHFERALALQPDHAPALSGLASLLEMQRDYDAAYALLDPHIAQGASAPELLVVYATVLQRLGRTGDAIAVLEREITRSEHRDTDRMVLHFKLGDLLDREQRYERAYTHYRTANALKKTDFDATRHRNVAMRIMAAFDADAQSRLPRSGNDSELPVFIVGMPRSGTSLVEQIIASHPDAFGAGELAMIGLQAMALPSVLNTQTPYPECVAEADAGTLAGLAEQYLGRLDALAPGARRVTDKMWQNYENLGLIALLFPRARVIHCRRDPRDSLLSCYFQLFGASGIPFSYSTDNLRAAYDVYRDLMAHWQSTLTMPILEVNYEELVADPEPGIRRIVDFTGLPWHDACLNFHKTERTVTTASYDQVRQPIYTGSMGRYRHYTPWLGDWFDSLADL